MSQPQPNDARVPLLPLEAAPGVRDYIRGPAELRLRELVPGWGLLAPREGLGVVREYFTAHRLADATTDLGEKRPAE